MPNDARQRTNTSTSTASVDSLRLQTFLSSSTSSNSAKSPVAIPSGASQSSHLSIQAALDAAHGNSKAALEAVLAERNMLSSQNAQLWKLIEKQRSGYANVLRELERVRAERDQARYKGGNLPTSVANASENETSTSRHRPSNGRPSEDNGSLPAVNLKEDTRNEVKTATPSPELLASRTTPSPSSTAPQIKDSSSVQQEAPNGSSQSDPIPITSTIEPLRINKERVPPSSTIAIHPPKSVPPDATVFATPNPSPMNLAPPLHIATGMRDKVVRESTISLPAEARNYIANMADSPARSPIVQRSRSSSPEKIRPSPLAEGTPAGPSVQPTAAHPRTSEEGRRESKPTSQPPTPRATEPPNRRPTDLRLRINGLHGSDSNPALIIGTDQTSTPGEEGDQDTLNSVVSTSVTSVQMSDRYRLSELELSAIAIRVKTSTIRPNDRGKEVLSFIIEIEPPSRVPWRIEKLYSNVLNLDTKIRTMTSRAHIKKLASLPDSKLFKDNAPAKVDQRKLLLEKYLQSVLTLPVKKSSEICDFFCTDIIDESRAPVAQMGYKEGYLTKRGKNFGGWKTRYFVLQGPILEYYENRGGAHLGSIQITGSQIGRQQKSAASDAGDENEYRHAFLIIEAKRGTSGQNRHVLCAESDSERDSWVDVLVRYVSGAFDDTALSPAITSATPRSTSTPSRISGDGVLGSLPLPVNRKLAKTLSKDDIARGHAVPISKLPPEMQQGKLFQGIPLEATSAVERLPPMEFPRRAPPDITHLAPDAPDGEQLSSSLPSSSPLDHTAVGQPPRPNSELGHYPDSSDLNTLPPSQATPSRSDRSKRQSYAPSLSTVHASPTIKTERPVTPDLPTALPTSNYPHISRPTNGTVIPPGSKFGNKDNSNDNHISERDRKTKSTAFWRFGRGDKAQVVEIPRAVFGVTLPETLAVAQIANLPAVVFRCIQYLENKKADEEEGIYRLSGSSAVIKSLKERFNAECDVDLLNPDECWDPHAVAGLLKQFFRELPVSVLTREAHPRFLGVMDLASQEDRIAEMTSLISQLPQENYSLLRALSAHLIRVVQNSSINKMTVRNIGIVFSPTLGIPAGVFSLMLNDFKRVFGVEGDETAPDEQPGPSGSSRRNSRTYQESAADQLLGLSGRSLPVTTEGLSSDTEDDLSMHVESEGETDDVESENPLRSHEEQGIMKTPPRRSASQDDTALRTPRNGRAAHLAAERGLHINTADERAKRQSRQFVGLPRSPRPQPSTPLSGHVSGSIPNTPR